ncbi:MAG: hypothetical protein GX927_05585 [Lentisphaerae bacterium]|nr:hypothetical protein [Lentisphaerota bacterium]
MKHRITGLLLLIFTALCLQARHDGSYMLKVNDFVINPVLDWGQGVQAPLKVLFATTRFGARDVVELSLRMPLEREVFISQAPRRISNNSSYEAALTGMTQYEREAELRDLAQKRYQVIVLGGIALTAMPYDVQCQLLQQVREGAGLICINEMPSYKKLLSNKVPRPDFAEEAVLPPGIAPKSVQTCQFGEGRVMLFKVNSWHYFLPQYEFDSTWCANYENAHLFMIQALRWAAGTTATAMRSKELVPGADFVLQEPLPGVAVRCRLRNEYNQILAEIPLKDGKGKMPRLPNGTFYADFLAADGKVSSQRFSLQSALGDVQLETPEGDSYEGKKVIPVKISWDKALPGPLGLVVELIGLPRLQVWHRQEFPVGSLAAGSKNWQFNIENFRVPTAAAELSLQWFDAEGGIVAQTRQILFFPNRELPDYFQLGWDVPKNPLYSRQLVERYGYTFGLTHPQPTGNRNVNLLNSRFVPYLTRIILSRGPNGEVTQRMLHQLSSKEIQEAYKALGADQSFARPEVRDLIVKQVAWRMQDLPKYGPPLYSLGDENGNSISSGYGESDLPAFRQFIEKKYKDIAILNREWKSQYASFAEVPHLQLADALAAGKPAAWNDHHEYMERMYADIHHLYAQEIRKLDPLAKVGLEGTFGGDNFEQMMDGLDWWGPYSNLVEDEVLRSLYPNVPRFLWAGYHNERGPDKFPRLTGFLLKGSVNGNGWFSTNAQDVHSFVSVDYSPSFPEHFMAELQRLRFGLAQLLVNNPLKESGLLVYWSHLSRRATKVDGRCVTPESGMGPLLRFCYRTGLSLEFVSSRCLDRLERGKVLMLLGASCLNPQETAAILSFVEKGGTVIADINPAVLNRYMNPVQENPLQALFGNLILNEACPALAIKELAVTLPDGSVFKADKALQNPALPCFNTKKYGRGQAILLNFNFAIVESSADPSFTLTAFLEKLFAAHGVSSSFTPDADTVFRVRQGQDFDLLGFRSTDGDINAGKVMRIALPEKRFIYECGRGFLGRQAQIEVKQGGQSLYLFSSFAKKQDAPAVKIPKKITRGTILTLDFSKLPKGRVLCLKITAPDGEDMLERALVVDTARKPQAELQFAWNDLPGKYQMLLEDVTTGLNSAYSLELE